MGRPKTTAAPTSEPVTKVVPPMHDDREQLSEQLEVELSRLGEAGHVDVQRARGPGEKPGEPEQRRAVADDVDAPGGSPSAGPVRIAGMASPYRERFSGHKPRKPAVTRDGGRSQKSSASRGMPTKPWAPPVSGRFSTATPDGLGEGDVAIAR